MLEAGRPGAVPSAGIPEQDSRPPSAGRLSRALGAAVFVLVVAVLWYLYLHVSRTQRVEADGASNALQGWDMLHGNLLLRGWTLEDVSFYTTELPVYMLVEAVRGLSADTLHAAAALVYALLVPLAAVLAKGRATGREGLVRMLIAGGILLAPQPGAGVFIVLFQPDHFGTQVPLLLTWLVLDRAPRRWYLPVVIGVLLTWIGIADPIADLVGVVPLVLVCGVRALRIWRRSMPWRDMPRLAWRRAGLGAAWYELALAAAAIVSVPVTSAVVKLINALGGYTVLPVSTQLATVSALPTHIRLATDGVLGLFGASFQGPPHGAALVFAILHLAGLALAIWAFGLALIGFFRARDITGDSTDDIIVQVLAVSIVVNIAAYLVSGRPTAYWSVREIAPILSAGAVLAGRLLGSRITRAVPASRPDRPLGGVAGRRTDRPLGGVAGTLLASVLAVVLASSIAALGYAATRPSVPGVGQDLAGWLKSHDLTYGLSYYGLAAPTTLASGNTVNVLTVVTEPGRMAPGPHEYNLNWYDSRTHDANFFVLLAKPGSADPMTSAQARAAFGPAAHEYRYREYLIMTWDKNLLSELGPAVSYVGITPG
jgi:hypothetical protein